MEFKRPNDRFILALDVPTATQAINLISELRSYVGGFKIGLELITAGHHIPVTVQAASRNLCFYDGKLCDIPNTVGAATREAAKLGASMINVHATAGPATIEAAAKEKGPAKLLAVTLLTSIDVNALERMWRPFFQDAVVPPLAHIVEHLAVMAVECGADGIICSAKEIATLRHNPKTKGTLLVVPDTRSSWYGKQDQKRVSTPAEAVAAGADYLVMGRQLTNPPEGTTRLEAIERTVAEIETEGGQA